MGLRATDRLGNQKVLRDGLFNQRTIGLQALVFNCSFVFASFKFTVKLHMRTGVRLDDSPFHTCSLFLKCCGTFPSWGKVTVPVIYRHLGVKEAIGTWMVGELCMSISKDITFPSVGLAWTPFSLYRCSYETKCSLYHHIQMPGMNGLLLIMARKTI